MVKILHMNQEQTAMELTNECGLDKSNISHENFQSNVGKIELKLVWRETEINLKYHINYKLLYF